MEQGRCLIQTLLTSSRLIPHLDLGKDVSSSPVRAACISTAEDHGDRGAADGWLRNLRLCLLPFVGWDTHRCQAQGTNPGHARRFPQSHSH